MKTIINEYLAKMTNKEFLDLISGKEKLPASCEFIKTFYNEDNEILELGNQLIIFVAMTKQIFKEIEFLYKNKKIIFLKDYPYIPGSSDFSYNDEYNIKLFLDKIVNIEYEHQIYGDTNYYFKKCFDIVEIDNGYLIENINITKIQSILENIENFVSEMSNGEKERFDTAMKAIESVV